MNRSVNFLAGIFIFLLVANGMKAQEIVTPLAGNPSAKAYYSANRKMMKSSFAPTLELPIFEDFSNSYIQPDPSLWSDADAFVNNSYCIDPVTNGVATLDAIDYQGSIYEGATFDPVSFVADHLTSHQVNLAYPPGDSIYFSFLYQPKGLGEVPEEQDSLLVDFYSPSDTAWINVWSTPGTELHAFKTVMIPITEAHFLTDSFQFRFRNRASLANTKDFPDKLANVDHWNVDYIRLDRNRFVTDTIRRDVAFNRPLSSILIDLSSVPWSHFPDAYATILDQNVAARYINNDTIARNVTRSILIQEPYYGESYTPASPTAQDLPAQEDTLVEFEYFYPIEFDRGDSALVRIKASLRTESFDPKDNDTVIYDQLFKDYYSYDDGTAEAGWGLRGQGTKNSTAAVKYHSYTADEIGGVDISFNQLYDSVNLSYYFKFIVWEDNGGIPGSRIFEDEKELVPDYTTRHPGFIRYYFSEPVQVDGDFYVGWQQYNQYMLNVGLDLNSQTSSSVLFYNYQGIWEKSIYPGVILLRPFLYDETVGIGDQEPGPESLQIYPNPASDQISIKLPGNEETGDILVDIYDSSGRLAQQKTIQHGRQLDVSELSGGIYFLKLRCSQGLYHSKLLINK